MPKTVTHNAILLRPPPGTRFTIWGHDVELQFERGREDEVRQWLKAWIESFAEYDLKKGEQLLAPPPETKPEIVVEVELELCGATHNEYTCSLLLNHTGWHASVSSESKEIAAGWPQGDNTHEE
jgi:hypothetical protein